jgi:hypothetical protein
MSMSTDLHHTFNADFFKNMQHQEDFGKTYTTSDMTAAELERFVHAKKENMDLTADQFIRMARQK